MANGEDYGIDAPGVVRAMGLSGLVLLGYGLLPKVVPGASLAHQLWPTAASLLVACGWMLASSLWIKRRVMRSLMNQRRWVGDETVLDIGCGRGLVTIEAARRVPQGRVHGVDLWQTSDLSGNSPEAIRTNAAIAGVSERLVIETGDARDLPYGDASFEVVCSMTAIHNIPDAEGRRKAISEAWRVLKPGGQILVFDIRHARGYLKQLREMGGMDTALHGPVMLWGPVGWRIGAMKPLGGERVAGVDRRD